MFLSIPLLYFSLIWYQYQNVLAIFSQGTFKGTHSFWIFVFDICTCVFCFMLLYGLIWQIQLDKGFTHTHVCGKRCEMCICLWQEFDLPDVTLCGRQDVKIQLLTSLSIYLMKREVSNTVKKKLKIKKDRFNERK